MTDHSSDEQKPVGNYNNLEEECSPIENGNPFKTGDRLKLGGEDFAIVEAKSEGWFIVESNRGQFLYHPLDSSVAYLDFFIPQREEGQVLLPVVARLGEEGYLLGEGSLPKRSVSPLSLQEAVGYLRDLARLAIACLKKGRSMIDIWPEDLLLDENGQLRLLRPPKVVPLEKEIPPSFTGVTPPEVQKGKKATGKEAVYLLGTIAYYLVTGERPPETGINMASIGEAGLPQILAKALLPQEQRPDLETFAKYLDEIPQEKLPAFAIGGKTTIGLNQSRETNEDAYGYSLYCVENHLGPQQVIIACVSDGMGGMEAGELASQAAVKVFLGDPLPENLLKDVALQVKWTVDLVKKANEAVIAALNGANGGCTLTGVVIAGNRLSLAHVGDTRAYLFEAGKLTPITKDHSLVAAMVAMGQITPEEAHNHPNRSAILRSLGSQKHLQEGYVDTLKQATGQEIFNIQPGQAVLLVTDGVWDEVSDSTLANILLKEEDPAKACAAIVQKALDAGAPDNATALLVRRLA